MVTFSMTLLMNKYTNIVMDDDEFIHWPKPFLLLSVICDVILTWMIEIWMQNHLVCDNTCNTLNL